MATKGAKVKKTRVFELARELGVSSKDVIEKCRSEEIPDIKGHMSAVSVGLEATIREWFSTGAPAASTAVETAAPVNVVQAQAKARKKAAKKKVTPTLDGQPAEEPVVATMAPPVETPAAPPPPEHVAVPPAAAPAAPADPIAPIDPEPIVIAPAPAAPVEPPSIAAEAPTLDVTDTPATAAPDAAPDGAPAVEIDETPGVAPQIAASAAAARKASAAGPVMNVPVRPDKITRAGPQLQQPTKTKLAGPKVIRVESPDTVPPPQPRRVDRGARTGRGVGPAQPGDPFPPGTPIRGGDGRPGAGSPTRRNQRRSASAGRDGGRTGRSMQGYGAGRTFNWREQDLLERERRLNRSAGFIKAARRDSQKRSAPGGIRTLSAAHTGGEVTVEEPITIKSLSSVSGVKVNDIIRQLVKGGHDIARPDAVLTAEIATEVMLPYDIELEIIEQKTAEQQIEEEFKERTLVNEQPRSPVITILGHVDHGKTTLLDRIRKANVAEGEAGGITQATSAFRVPVSVGEGERTITFIDTPGHEAFTEMRSRGAKVTDLVVLVVAADDGVMPQTAESISHAKAAGVPIIVALNKVDKPEATDPNIQRILGQLAEHELNPVDWGGQTEIVRMSALKDEGIQDLLEVLDFQSQLLELTADFGGSAAGTVIEAHIAEGRGPVANVLVQQGELKKGDYVVVGRAYGRVRNLMDDRGKQAKSVLPSTPVSVAGLTEVPDAGDKFYVVKNQKEAEAAASERKMQERERGLTKEKVTLDNIFEKLSESERKELPLIVKTDVQGSLETLKSTLPKIGSDEVVVVVKHAAVGGVNESDISLAEASGAIVVGFNVTTSAAARRLAEARGVDIRLYDVIYDLSDDVTRAAEGLLEPELRLEVLGHAEVRQVFKVSKVGMVAGCYCTEGTIERNAKIRVTRGDIVVEKDRRLEQLKRFKDDAKSVMAGQECGMRIDGYDDIKEGDILECYKTLEVRRSLSD